MTLRCWTREVANCCCRCLRAHWSRHPRQVFYTPQTRICRLHCTDWYASSVTSCWFTFRESWRDKAKVTPTRLLSRLTFLTRQIGANFFACSIFFRKSLPYIMATSLWAADAVKSVSHQTHMSTSLAYWRLLRYRAIVIYLSQRASNYVGFYSWSKIEWTFYLQAHAVFYEKR